MMFLADNWFISPLFDVEYKSYQVLNYVKHFKYRLEQKALFPYFDDLLRHIQNIETLERAKNSLDQNLISQSFNTAGGLEVNHDSVVHLNEILSFAMGHFQQCRKEAEFVLDNLFRNVHVSELGLVDPSAYGGFVLISQNKETRVYTYEHRMVLRPNTMFQYKDIKTSYTKTVPSIESAIELKWEILKSNQYRAGINTYLVECDTEIPHFESLMPMVKNHLLANSQVPLY